MSVAGELAYYVDDFCDEIMPCDPTLEAWAAWLSRPDREWKRAKAAADGEQFKASVTRWGEDVVATRCTDGWQFTPLPEGVSFLAVRWAEGSGWSPDNIVWGEDMGEALRDWFAENDDACEDREFIAVGFYEPPVMLTYRADPPRLILEGHVQ